MWIMDMLQLRRLTPWRSGLNPIVVHLGLIVEKVTLMQVLFQELQFSPVGHNSIIDL
jgi:hypothetical protein